MSVNNLSISLTNDPEKEFLHHLAVILSNISKS
jgi:hypothetical protein